MKEGVGKEGGREGKKQRGRSKGVLLFHGQHNLNICIFF